MSKRGEKILLPAEIVQAIKDKFKELSEGELRDNNYQPILRSFVKKTLPTYKNSDRTHGYYIEHDVPSARTIKKALNIGQKKDHGIFCKRDDDKFFLNLLSFFATEVDWDTLLKDKGIVEKDLEIPENYFDDIKEDKKHFLPEGEVKVNAIHANPLHDKRDNPQIPIFKRKTTKAFLFALLIIVLGLTYLNKDADKDHSISKDTSSGIYEKDNTIHGFNDRPEDCKTVRIVDTKDSLLTSNNCWGTQVINIEKNTIINIVIYYHNTSEKTAQNVRVRLNQYTDNKLNKTIFSGIITINDKDTIRGYAEAIYNKPKAFLYRTIKKYDNKSRIPSQIYEDAEIFTEDGLLIGDIPGIQDCPIMDFKRDATCHEGWLMISFTVVNKLF